MVLKRRAKLEEKAPEVLEEEEDSEVPEIEPARPTEQQLLQTKNALCHPGEASYHLITQLQILNQTMLGIGEELKRANDLLEEDLEEEESEE